MARKRIASPSRALPRTRDRPTARARTRENDGRTCRVARHRRRNTWCRDRSRSPGRRLYSWCVSRSLSCRRMTARAMGRRKDGRGRNFFCGRLDMDMDMGGRGLIGIGGSHGNHGSVGWTQSDPTVCVHISVLIYRYQVVYARGGRAVGKRGRYVCAYTIEVCVRRRLWVRSTLVVFYRGLCASSVG